MEPTHRVVSPDGTTIAYESTGSGAPLVLVEPAGHYRGLSAFDGLRPELARRFTVYSYDRRGRGDSDDVGPYAPDREADDLASLIDAIGSPVLVFGHSSGALLALLAAARGLPISRLAVLEPPLQEPGTGPDPLTGELESLTAEGRLGEAVEHLHRSIGVPDELLAQMRSTPTFDKMAAIAPTLVYDCRVSDAMTPEVLSSVRTPTLVLDSTGSSDDLTGWAASVARQLPNAIHRSLPGRWHVVDDDVLAAALTEFFNGAP